MEETPYTPKIQLFVCINDRSDRENSMPSCGPHISVEDVRSVKLWIREQGWTGAVVATKCLCLGLCNPKGGVATIYPSGRMFKGITTIDELKKIVREEVEML